LPQGDPNRIDASRAYAILRGRHKTAGG
jgi:hypothetical protein